MPTQAEETSPRTGTLPLDRPETADSRQPPEGPARPAEAAPRPESPPRSHVQQPEVRPAVAAETGPDERPPALHVRRRGASGMLRRLGLGLTEPGMPSEDQFDPARSVPSGSEDPAPGGRRIVGICAWNTALGLAGLAIALRGVAAILGGDAPDWYQPATAAVGLTGIALTLGALMLEKRPRLPWMLLGAATVPLAVNLGLTISAL